MENLDLVINNGLVINSRHKEFVNLGVRDGKISLITTEKLSGAKKIDAEGKWVIPGAIDTHVHYALKQGQGEDAVMTEDDYESGPIASAVGGITTFIDYAICPQKGKLKTFLDERIDLASKGSCIDFSFHCGITNASPESLNQMPGVIEMGIPSFKFFVTYKKWGFAVDLGFLWGAFNLLNELNGVACIHCEQDDIIEFLRATHAAETDMALFGATRPDFTEEIAVAELVILAREAGSRLHVVHLTTQKALNVIKEAQSRGLKIRTETCPHYLYYSDGVYKQDDGYLYTMTPPLRPKGNSDALWEGLKDGSIGIFASDHNALGLGVKNRNPEWLNVAPGLGGSELILTFLHSEGVVKRKMSPEKMVELLSSSPAAEFGVPNKGKLELGYDADIVVFDPNKIREIKHSELATPGGFSIYEGLKMQGWPEITISRGEVIVQDRKFVGNTGRGKYIPRKIDKSVW